MRLESFLHRQAGPERSELPNIDTQVASAINAMSLNESIVEDAALEWFGELGCAVGHGPRAWDGMDVGEEK